MIPSIISGCPIQYRSSLSEPNLLFSGLHGLGSTFGCTTQRKRKIIGYPGGATLDNINTLSCSIYSFLEEFLAVSNRRIDLVVGDGNCFFRSLSKEVFGSEKFHRWIRIRVVEYMNQRPALFSLFLDGNETIEEHVEKMKADKVWATTAEIFAGATFLGMDIYLLTPVVHQKYEWFHFRPLRHINGKRYHVTLCHTGGEHFDRIIPIDHDDNRDCLPPICIGSFLDYFYY
ncbi:OTU domain-containing protein 3-like [Argonauta hians]